MTPDLQTPRAQAKGGKAAFGFIFGVALLNTISFALLVPVLPNLIKEFNGGDTATASEWNVAFAVVWGLIQFFAGPILGALSDRVGRRPILLISLFGLAADFLLMALAPNLTWLLIGRMLNGATAATFSTANAYVADITPHEGRAKAFGWMGAAFSMGFLCGPAIGGMLAEYDLRLPFFVAAGLTFANALYGYFILPESLPPERRSASLDLKRANPLGGLKLLRSHGDLPTLAGINFCFQMAIQCMPTVMVLYMGYRFGWSIQTVGLVMMSGALSQLAIQGLLVGPVIRRIGERGAVMLGAAFSVAGLFVYAFATEGWMYLVGQPLFAMSSLVHPGLQSLMSRRVSHTEQGRLQGTNQSLMAVAAILGPPIFGLTFAWSIKHEEVFHMPGLALLIAAAMHAAVGLLAFGVRRNYVPR
jgi:DHA1 family tetracycline resistance protein-like MFS transporter